MLRIIILAFVAQYSGALNLNDNAQFSRRNVFSATTAAAVAVAPLLAPPPIARAASEAPESSFETQIIQKDLLAGLATSPVRDIIVTGTMILTNTSCLFLVDVWERRSVWK